MALSKHKINPYGYDEELVCLPDRLKLDKTSLREHVITKSHKFRAESDYGSVPLINKNLFLIFGRYVGCGVDLLRDFMVLFTKREYEYINSISEDYQKKTGLPLKDWLKNIAEPHRRGNELVVFLLSLMCNVHTTTLYRNGYLSTVEDNHSGSQAEAVKNSQIVLAFGGNNFYMELIPRSAKKCNEIVLIFKSRLENTDLLQWFKALDQDLDSETTSISLSEHSPPAKQKPKRKRRPRQKKQRTAVTKTRPEKTTPTTGQSTSSIRSTASTKPRTKNPGAPKSKLPKQPAATTPPPKKRRKRTQYICPQPGCTFTTRGLGYFNTHHRSKHRNVKFPCPDCGKIFNLESSLKRHSFEHQKKQYRCTTCNQSFRFKSELSTHREEHYKRRMFKCETCGCRYKLRSGLVRHQAKHSGMNWRCEYCNYSTNERRLLRLHKVVHSSPKLQCKQCNKRFRHGVQLRRHKKKEH